jgi:hypothetical protein
MIRHMLLTHAFMARLVLLVLPALLVASCGQEAPQRAMRATPSPSPYATRTPAPVTLPTVAVDIGTPVTMPDGGSASMTAPEALNRTLGDPDAPITVVEYSDYQ